jgi:polysaccharide deacetylase 2 family uncharacterized protein YibQ
MARRSRKFKGVPDKWRKWLFALLFLAGGLLLGIQIGNWTAPKKTQPHTRAVSFKTPASSQSKSAASAKAAPKAATAPAKKTSASVVREKAAERYDAPANVPVLPARTARTSSAPKVSIVLDDWGYNLKALTAALEVREPLTLAVLPNLPYSAEVARKAHAAGHEIILHMPMEPLNDVPLEEGTILTSMAPAEIRGLLSDALAGIPHARGVNNHMGSKVTQDRRTLDIIMRELAARKLFFLNSMTSGSAAGRETAGEVGIAYAERDIFIDNERTEAAVITKLQELKAAAVRQGSAIGIGHDEPVTLRAIQKVLPSWKAEGIEIIRLSDLIRHYSEGS